MSKFEECKFSGASVVLDGNEYINSAFLRCRIIVTRGNFSLKGCVFEECQFEFGGEAGNIRNLVLSLVNQQITKPSPETKQNPPSAERSPASSREPDDG